MARLNHSLWSLVRDSRDPFLLVYVIENLGKSVPPSSKYYQQFFKYRIQFQQLLIAVHWNPLGAWGLRGPAHPQLAKQILQQGQALKKALLDEAYKEFMAKQFEKMVEEQTKQAEKLDRMLRELAAADGVVVINNLQDPDPMKRWLAVLVAGKKRMAIEEYLINLLADPHPSVRYVAHQSLMRIARSTDFGPTTQKATAKQIARSQELWRNWLNTQVETRLEQQQSRKTSR